MTQLFALVDCNNFFASCERIFNPKLRGKPVVVLSNNDGCVIARSNEAKAAGIRMGEPYFKCQQLIASHDVHVYSANFVLYGDISNRVMSTLAQYTPEMEVYSIDEAFLSLDGLCENPYDYVKSIREQVKRNTGMPVSVGVSLTKTLAKVANHAAKKHSQEGVFCLADENEIDQWLEKTDVGDVWGIGRQKSEFLKRHGIENALQLKNAPDSFIKQYLTVVSLKTVWELRGIPCLDLEETVPDKKAITTSRTFGREVSTLEELTEAAAAYIGLAAEKLRSQDSVCGHLQVYAMTNRFKGQFYANSAGIDVTPPTAHTPTLITAASKLVKEIYRSGHSYKKAGVILSHLQMESKTQGFLFEEIYHNSRKQRLMKTMDRVNEKAGSARIFMAAEGIKQPWYMNQSHKSKRFTTSWRDLLEIDIGI